MKEETYHITSSGIVYSKIDMSFTTKEGKKRRKNIYSFLLEGTPNALASMQYPCVYRTDQVISFSYNTKRINSLRNPFSIEFSSLSHGMLYTFKWSYVKGNYKRTTLSPGLLVALDSFMARIQSELEQSLVR